MANSNAKSNDTKPEAPQQFQFAQKPVERPGWEGFTHFLWNSETSEFLGRTGCSWFKIGLFYLIYYTFLAGYFIAMLLIFYQTLDDQQPKWQNANGIIGDNPGLGFRPRPGENNVESTLMKFRHGDPRIADWDLWAERLDLYMEDYKRASDNKKPSPDAIQCGFDRPPGEGQICQVESSNLMKDNCTKDASYGYKDGKPCVLLKLNRIYGWVPELFANSSDLPEEAPQSLITYIKEKEKSNDPMVGNMVWLSCEGENPADRENIGEIEYKPYPGIPKYYFPYKNQKGYLSPAIFAHFTNPKHGVLISISCRAWAKNIRFDYMERIGSVHFEMMID
ncbi:hypothetical protein TCAL_06434 [Tigriopus californicus]|uniref:Sodium/potassium-transporting ATPase subunit beta n=1 Tax=Tigriopus californicus TaxID=6832 RepID=A0A553NR12_TIGCA|nr:sodium/potassium-transporting ATPase subunit beta-like [Tigriopus californicus]XP_059082080.1 sodium/potassium-transporting ATPase subunit beta-like [Tigriopus californicus]TRY67875.1 hypothetical protein TCAL_06434 [Tigriopus californicus]